MSLINEEDLSISAEQIAKDGLTALDKKYHKSVGFFAWNYFVVTGKIVLCFIFSNNFLHS